MPKRDERLLTFAKQMRREPAAEQRLWNVLRAKRLEGVKFVHQSLVAGAIPDFVARSHKLAVEVDGETHDFTAGRDAARTARLKADGYRVLRFTNEDVVQNLEGVLSVIREALVQPSPRRGEGRLPGSQGEGPVPCVRTLPLPASLRSPTLSPEGRGLK